MPDTSNTPRQLRVAPLWVRVDQNRVKLSVFVVLFVVGSALLLESALVVLPGTLFSLLATDVEQYFDTLVIVIAATFGGLLAIGAFAAAVQLSNAEDWVRARFSGSVLEREAAPELHSAIDDMAIAAGVTVPIRVLVLDTNAVNAFALGTTRSRPVIGVTRGLLEQMTVEEERAVVATLIARITAGDIMFGTALAALMGPLKAVRDSRKGVGDAGGAVVQSGCGDPGCADAGCANGCSDTSGCLDGLTDADSAGGCLGVLGVILFVMLVIAITYLAVITAAWLVTLWGRALQRTAYEKADAEGMLLLKDPAPMLSALRKAVSSSNEVGMGDPSYDGIFYAGTGGTPAIERRERRRYDRLREVLGTEGIAAPPL